MRRLAFAAGALALSARLGGSAGAGEPCSVAVRGDNVLTLDGRPVFPIGFTKAPPPDGRTPSGGDAYRELASIGTVFHRAGVPPKTWGPEAERELDRVLDRSAEAGIFAALYVADLARLARGDAARETELRRVVARYARHPAVMLWKGADEPEWGKVPVAEVQRFYDVVHALDPRHPVWITQAPRGTVESLRAYDAAYDVAALDIYPVSYPPGIHGHFPNRSISVVGDYARFIRDATRGRKPFFMVLQIAFSGVIKPGKTLRFPTLAEQRYMAYQSIIHGARGLIYFGGDLAPAMNARDRALGWNWTYYDRALRPVLEELRPDGPLFPALVAPESKLPLRVSGADDVELAVREAAGAVYVLAAKREGATVQAKLTGLPAGISSGEVLYEEPRRVAVSGGAFTDWFGPNEVHVYRFR